VLQEEGKENRPRHNKTSKPKPQPQPPTRLKLIDLRKPFLYVLREKDILSNNKNIFQSKKDNYIVNIIS
jgi:hypothetical protein